MENWPIFVATVTLLVLTPGPSVLLALSHGIRYGRLKALQTIAGNVSANSIQILLASLGLGLLLKNAPLLFHAVKWVGVGYILLRISSQGSVAHPACLIHSRSGC